MPNNSNKTIKVTRKPHRAVRMPSSSSKQSDSASLFTLFNSLKNNKNSRSGKLYTPMSTLPTIPIYYNQVKGSLETVTTIDQDETEEKCVSMFTSEQVINELQVLKRAQHIAFLRQTIGKLPAGFVRLDASRAWAIYWALSGLCVLDDDISDLKDGANEALLGCLSPTGGIGGNVGQLPHLAPTYAGLNALAITGNENVWSKIDKTAFYKWLLKLKQPNGGFVMHEGGECDVRAVYCALTISSLLGVLDEKLTENVGSFLARCQSFEGGFAGAPDMEAHGGYAFCSLASLCLIYPPHEVGKYINIPKFTRWLSARQHQPEGGFSGRTNKLVDACYSHWVGGCWALLNGVLGHSIEWDRSALQNYTLYCSQIKGSGGLRDKPDKRADGYHTNYSLCGLSGAQHKYWYDKEQANNAKLGDYGFMWKGQTSDAITIEAGNQVEMIHPVYVLPMGVPERMNAFFKST